MNTTATANARAVLVLMLALTGITPSVVATASPTSPSFRAACAPAPIGSATCEATVRFGTSGLVAGAVRNQATKAAGPAGYGPADIRSAYHLPAAGAGRTVAIVDGYDDPTAASDLAKYRTRYHLPACTTHNGCLHIVNQDGGSSLPQTNAAWSTEISLDLDMVSATCARCRILLVEATTSSMANLATAVDYAATQHVAAISNSYSGADTAQVAAYNHPGIAITAATGDTSSSIGAPASFDTVIAVGGTTLQRARNARGWIEKPWASSNRGCSTLNGKPSWQSAVTHCAGKAAADVSAVANPKQGVAIYDSTIDQGVAGWQISGGTSAATAIIAGVYAMSAHLSRYPAAYTWAHASRLHDVAATRAGSCQGATAQHAPCDTRAGWNASTGLGSPDGLSGF